MKKYSRLAAKEVEVGHKAEVKLQLVFLDRRARAVLS